MSSTGDSGGTKSSFDPVVKVDSYSPCPLVVSERSGAPNFHVSELRKLCVYVCGVGGGAYMCMCMRVISLRTKVLLGTTYIIFNSSSVASNSVYKPLMSICFFLDKFAS